jgi:hypothetical protein
MTIRKIHSNNVTNNRTDISTQYDELFFDDVANSLLLPDPAGLLEMKIGPVSAGSSGPMNYYTTTSPVVTVNGGGQTIATATFTSYGNPVYIAINGDANPVSSGEQYCVVQFYRDGVAIGNQFMIDCPSANINACYNFTAWDTPTAGAHVYTLRTVAGKSFNGSFTFGEAGGPQWGFVELAGAVGPKGDTGVGIKGFASGYVDAGQFVTLDNLKFSVTTGGQRGLCCATVSGTATLSISANYALAGGASGYATTYPGANYTTTPSGSWFGWSFANAGDGSTYMVNDYTNQRFYRVHLMIGASYLKNFISIERLG